MFDVKNAAKVLLFFDISKKKSAETLFSFILSLFHSLIPEFQFPLSQFHDHRFAAIHLTADDLLT